MKVRIENIYVFSNEVDIDGNNRTRHGSIES